MNLPAGTAGAWVCCGMLLIMPLSSPASDALPPLLAEERERWAACVDGPRQLTLSPDTGLRRGAPIYIGADFMVYDRRTDTWVLRGDVELERADQVLRADQMRFDEAADRVEVQGNVRYSQDGLKLGSSGGFLNLRQDRGELDAVQYLLTESLAQGVAGHVRQQNADVLHLSNASYSTCEPGDEFWELKVSRMRLDQETGVGEAWHARMEILGLPVAYTPYLNFPIDDRRKSGLLPPTLQQSTRSGTDFLLPYYWNIAPNYDATISPRYLSKRGLGLESEFRYLLPRQSGDLRGSVLPSDDDFGDDRWSLAWDHRARLSGNTSARLEFNRVSDDQYFQDFGNTLNQSSQTFLPSRAQLAYRTPDISADLRAQVYQTVTPGISGASQPYERLPQVLFGYTPERAALADLTNLAVPGSFWLEHRLDAEAVRFDHPEPDLRNTGTRLDMTPRVSLPLEARAGYLRPSLAMRITAYDLDRTAGADASGESITRSLPIASLDTGLYFDRFFTAFNRSLWQTLEPRLFYLYVPARDQDAIPLFDTGLAEPSLFQLFNEDRFLGPDRVGDANQVTMGLTSRFLNRDTGAEYLSLGIGQTYFFDDREVTLRPGAEADTSQRSDIIGELRATLPAGFRATAEAHWDPDADQVKLSSARLTWQPGPRTLLTTDYRLRQGPNGREIEQGNVAALLPLGRRWHATGGWRYALNEERTLESFVGLEYGDCCWTARLVNRYFREDPLEQAERSILLQFEFRGLGRLGDDIDDFLEQTVFGYQGTR